MIVDFLVGFIHGALSTTAIWVVFFIVLGIIKFFKRKNADKTESQRYTTK